MDIKNVSQMLQANVPLSTRLFEGNTITGKILTNENGKATVKLYDGSIIPAIIISENDVETNKSAKFVITNFDGENFVLRVVGENEDTKNQKSLNSIIRDLNIPFEEGKDIIMSLIKFNLPATNENITNLHKNLAFLNNLKTMSDSDILLFLKQHFGEGITEDSIEFKQTKNMFSQFKNVDLDFLTFMLENDILQNPENILKTQDFMKNKFYFNSFIDNVKNYLPNLNDALRALLGKINNNSNLLPVISDELKALLENLSEGGSENFPHIDEDSKKILISLLKIDNSESTADNKLQKNNLLNILKDANNLVATIDDNKTPTLSSVDKNIKSLLGSTINDLNRLLQNINSKNSSLVTLNTLDQADPASKNSLDSIYTDEKNILKTFLTSNNRILSTINTTENGITQTIDNSLRGPLSDFIKLATTVISNINGENSVPETLFDNLPKTDLLEILNNGNNVLSTMDLITSNGAAPKEIDIINLMTKMVKELNDILDTPSTAASKISQDQEKSDTVSSDHKTLTAFMKDTTTVLSIINDNDTRVNQTINKHLTNLLKQLNTEINKTLATLTKSTALVQPQLKDVEKSALLNTLESADKVLNNIVKDLGGTFTNIDKDFKNYISTIIKDLSSKFEDTQDSTKSPTTPLNKAEENILNNFLKDANELLTSINKNDLKNVMPPRINTPDSATDTIPPKTDLTANPVETKPMQNITRPSENILSNFVKDITNILSHIEDAGDNALSKYVKSLSSMPSDSEKLLMNSVIKNLANNAGIDKKNIVVTSLEETINIFKNNKETFSFISPESYNKLVDNLDMLKQVNNNYNMYYFNLYDGSNIFKNNIIIKNKYKGSKHIDINDVKAFITVDTQNIGKIEGNLYKKNNDISIAFSVNEEYVNLFKNNSYSLKKSLKEFGYNIINISVEKTNTDKNILPFSDFFNESMLRELDVKV